MLTAPRLSTPPLVLSAAHLRSPFVLARLPSVRSLLLVSIRLLVPVLVWLSLALVCAHSVLFVLVWVRLCSSGFRSCSFGFVCASSGLVGLVWARLCLFALSWVSFWAPQPLICVCIKYMVSMIRLTFIPCIINLCKSVD